MVATTVSSHEGDQTDEYRRAILDTMSIGEPFEEEELWDKVGGYVSFESFLEHMKILENKRMVRKKTFEKDGDCDGQIDTVQVTTYWIPFYEEFLDKKKYARDLARPYLEDGIRYLKQTIDGMERELGK